MLKRISYLLFCAVLVALSAQAWAQPVDAGYRDFSYAVSGGPTTPTGEKPESKLWFNDGFWWGSLYNNTVKGYHIYRFNVSSQSWTDTGTVLDPRSSSRADTLWDGQHLYVASHIFTTSGVTDGNSANWGRLYRYSYNSQTNSYSLDTGFPVNVTRGREESLVIAKDSTGQLWVTYVESQKVMVNRSTGGDQVWGIPFVLPASQTAVSVTTDDISGVLAFQGNKIGVMWSNQLRSKTYFAVHLDPDADTVWQTEQTALPGPNDTGAFSDDHINLKSLQADGSGRIFAAIKTSLTASNSPLVMLLVRDLSGNWSKYTFGRVQDHHTRPVVLLDQEHSRLYMFATAPEAGGTIYYKTTPINNIQFATGLGTPYIKSATDTLINNTTSTKQNLNSATGLLVLASDANSQNYLHHYLNLGATTNQAPAVNAGADQTITLPANATLSGTVTDDGLPNPPNAVTNTWTQVSGPGTVNFVNPNAASTTASFSASGTYVLRLTADDSALSSTDDVTVTVNPASPTNQAPAVSAGTDQTITLPSGATLSGTATDDGLPNPPGSMTITWTQFSGPGTTTFANAGAASTTASFSTSGTYVLRLTANDSALSSSDDVTVTVNPASSTNQAPIVSAGADQTITLPSGATLSGTASDDGLPNPPGSLTITWTKFSGPGTATFANASAASTTVSFSTSGTYVLRLTANDSALSSSDDVTVTVNPASPTNQAPVVSAGTDQTITLPASATLSGTVTDDGLPNPPNVVTNTWTKFSGPGTVTFANASAASTTASFSASGTYVLRLTADDSALSSSDDVTVTVNPAAATNQAPAVNAGADQTITLPADATLSGTVTDDGLPNPPNVVTNTWTQVSGPGTVNFVNPNAASTTASFSASGTYVLRLTADDSALSSTDDVTVTVNPAPPPGQSNMTFIEPGTDATQDFKLWSSTAVATGGSISSDSTLAHTGPRSIKISSGTATSGFVWCGKNGVLANTASRASSWVYITANATTSAGYGLLAARNPSGGAIAWTVNVDNAGRIRLNTNANVMLKLSTLTVPLNRWFRVSVAQQITSTTSYTIKVWVDGTLYISADGGTSPALNNIGGTQLGVGFLAGGVSGAGGAVQYHDDIYIDDGADLSDTGDVRVTAKLPGGDTTSTFGTAVGANPPFGSRYTNENERPLNIANGWTSNGAGQSERYLLQSPAEGDVNISGFVQLGYTGWIYAKRSAAGTESMVINGTVVTTSLTTSAAIYAQSVSGAGYPSSAAGIGVDASASGVTLYECGVLVAYLFN